MTRKENRINIFEAGKESFWQVALILTKLQFFFAIFGRRLAKKSVQLSTNSQFKISLYCRHLERVPFSKWITFSIKSAIKRVRARPLCTCRGFAYKTWLD